MLGSSRERLYDGVILDRKVAARIKEIRRHYTNWLIFEIEVWAGHEYRIMTIRLKDNFGLLKGLLASH